MVPACPEDHFPRMLSKDEWQGEEKGLGGSSSSEIAEKVQHQMCGIYGKGTD